MSKRLKQLQNRQAAIVAEMKGLSDRLGSEERDAFNEEEEARFKLLRGAVLLRLDQILEKYESNCADEARGDDYEAKARVEF